MRSSNITLDVLARFLVLGVTIHMSLSPHPSLFPLLDRFLAELGFQFAADTRYLGLACQENEDTPRWQLGMNFYRFLDGLGNIVWISSPAEVNRDGMLACSDADDRWRGRKQVFVLRKVADTEGGGHDNQPERL